MSRETDLLGELRASGMCASPGPQSLEVRVHDLEHAFVELEKRVLELEPKSAAIPFVSDRDQDRVPAERVCADCGILERKCRELGYAGLVEFREHDPLTHARLCVPCARAAAEKSRAEFDALCVRRERSAFAWKWGRRALVAGGAAVVCYAITAITVGAIGAVLSRLGW